MSSEPERDLYSPVGDAEHWPATSVPYLMWAYERARAMQTDLDSTVESIRKRAVIATVSHWGVVGWLMASTLGPHILKQPLVPKLLEVALMVASGLCMLNVIMPRDVQTPTIQALIGPDALANPIAGSLLAAVEQVDVTYNQQRVLSNQRGAVTAWCQGLACLGVLLALTLALL